MPKARKTDASRRTVGEFMEGDGATVYGDVITLCSDANTSEVLEEVHHFQQRQRGDYAEYDDKITTLLRERNARGTFYALRSGTISQRTKRCRQELPWKITCAT